MASLDPDTAHGPSTDADGRALDGRRSVDAGGTHAFEVIVHAINRKVEAARRLTGLAATIETTAQLTIQILRSGGKVLFFGNGGSAATAQHLAAELMGRFASDRQGLPAVALSADSSTVTAICNDYGYRTVFARQLEALGSPRDIAFALSTSGRSTNVMAGIESAKGVGMKTVALVGADGVRLAKHADVAMVVPSRLTAEIQESHLAICHIICELVDQAFAPVRESSPQC